MSTPPDALLPARRWLMAWTERLAAFGGLALIAVIAVEVASVVGGTFGKPILGDTEIVEILCGIAVACFMPYCQMRGANVIVDFFTMRASQRTRDVLDAIMYLVFAIVVAVLTERMIEGGITQFERDRISMFLRIPQWWGYAVASLASVLWTVVCLYTAWERAHAALARR